MPTTRADLRTLCADLIHRWALRLLSLVLLATLVDGDLAYTTQRRRQFFGSGEIEFCVEKVWPFWAAGTKSGCFKERHLLFTSPPFSLITVAYCAFFWNQWMLFSLQRQRSRYAWRVLGLNLVPATGLAVMQFGVRKNLDLWNVVGFIVPYVVFQGVILSGVVVEMVYVLGSWRSRRVEKEQEVDVEARAGKNKS